MMISYTFAAQSAVPFLDRLQVVATSPLALVGYVVLIVAFAFQFERLLSLRRHTKLTKLAKGVNKEDLPEVIRGLALGMPDKLTRAQERTLHLRMKYTFWGPTIIGILIFLAVVSVSAMHVWSLPASEIEKQLGRIEDQIDESQQEIEEQIIDSHQETVRQLTDPAALAESIRKQINESAQTEIDALPDKPGRGAKIAQIENQRDLALGRIDDLIRLIQEGLEQGATEVFQRATEILTKEGVDAALAYLESRRPSTLEIAQRHAQQVKATQARVEEEKQQLRQSVRPLLLEADLHQTKLQWEPALQLLEQAAALAPNWRRTCDELGRLLYQLARYDQAEPHLRTALELSADPDEVAAAINNLAILLQATNRLAEAEPLYRRALAIDEKAYGPDHPDVARDLNNLAMLLAATNRLAEAEPLYRRALAIDEQAYGPDHLDVARDLNNLAQLLQDTNRLAEAEPLMRRALEIDEQSYGPDHPYVARDLNNLAGLLRATDRLAEAEPLMRRALAIGEQTYGLDHPKVAICLNNLAELLRETHRLQEAEPLYRRALAIDEQAYGPDHPDVARDLNNLAQLLQDTNRLDEAEPLYRCVVTIFENSLGPNHPNVATAINNLAHLLQETSRLDEAEPLYRRALDIDEQSYGPDHPNVAIRLNNLAMLLQATNRLDEAEPLMRRVVTIFRQFGQVTGHEHPHMQTVLRNYRHLLEAMNLPQDEIEQRLAQTVPPTE